LRVRVFRRRPLPGRGAGAWVADVLTRGVRDPLGPGLEDEPLDRVGDREVQGQRRRTQTGPSASNTCLDAGEDQHMDNTDETALPGIRRDDCQTGRAGQRSAKMRGELVRVIWLAMMISIMMDRLVSKR